MPQAVRADGFSTDSHSPRSVIHERGPTLGSLSEARSIRALSEESKSDVSSSAGTAPVEIPLLFDSMVPMGLVQARKVIKSYMAYIFYLHIVREEGLI